jgi:hypothetical protein
MVIENPQISIFRKRSRDCVGSGTAATQSAPMVDKGETSTTDAPTFRLSATASGSPPPTLDTRPGTMGKNVGSTTPDVLL